MSSFNKEPFVMIVNDTLLLNVFMYSTIFFRASGLRLTKLFAISGPNCFKTLPRQALHARTLGFVHPTSGEFLRFTSEIPEEITSCIEKWRVYSKAVQFDDEN